MDLIVPMLARFVNVETAARLLLLASQILVVSGAIACEIEVRGRHQLSGFAALIALYSLPFLWGLMNFEFGCGVALWAIMFWIHYGEAPWLVRAAVHTCFVAVLFVAHFFALGIYGLTIGCYELSRVVGYRQAVRNFRHDGVSSCRSLPLSHRVRRFDWEARIRLVVRTEVVISVANHERLQPVPFNCTCGGNYCVVGVPWVQTGTWADAAGHFHRVRLSNIIRANADATLQYSICRRPHHYRVNANLARVLRCNLVLTRCSIDGDFRGNKPNCC